VEVCGITTELADAVESQGDEARAPLTRLARSRPALAAAARAAATREKTPLRPAATIPSPEKIPERMEGAMRGGGSEPALLFRLSARWLGLWTADG
jgi:hypothetical protein